MATKYFMAGGVDSKWSTDGNWSTTSSSGPANTTKAVNGDVATFDAGSPNATVDVASACTTLTCTGYTGTLTMTAGLSVAGSVTLASGMTLAGAGQLTITAAGTLTSDGITGANFTFTGVLCVTAHVTINTNGTTWPALSPSVSYGTRTFTLTSSFQCTTLSTANIAGNSTLAFATGAGAYDLTIGTLTIFSQSGVLTFSLTAGRTITVNTALNLAGGYGTGTGITIKSATAGPGTDIYFVNGATVAATKCSGVTFTDVVYSGTYATKLANWYGGTLTRTTDIYNVTDASFPAVADVKNAVEYGGADDASANRLTGTYSAAGGGGLMVNPGLSGGLR